MYMALREIPLFDSFTDAELQHLASLGKEIKLKAGEMLIREGDPPKGLFVLLEGNVEVYKQIGGQPVHLNKIEIGSFVGEISLLTGAASMASVRAVTECRFFSLEVRVFQDALNTSPTLNLLLSTMSQRLRATESRIQQHEKLSALGKLSAGLAHELNNPAAANLRAAKQLPETMATLKSMVVRLNQSSLSHNQLAFLNSLQEELIARAAEQQFLDALTQSDREDELSQWMDAHEVNNGWELAPMLVSAGITVEDFETLRDNVGDDALGDALTWIESTLTAADLLRIIEQSSTRISELVKAVKAYSYMDQSPQQEVDIHAGIENTLVILGHKLKNIRITRNYDRSLPRITVFGSELNQVWTNLIDNAVDAMEGHGELQISTWMKDDRIHVEIVDNGPGIPEEIQSRIFEPFFTTKEMGDGSGMGLDIAYRIIVERHGGNIQLFSKPGETRFDVCLPVEQVAPGQKA
jgi:signal transduction histidine kinase